MIAVTPLLALPLGEYAGGFKHHAHPKLPPRQLGRRAFGQHGNRPSVDDNVGPFRFHFARKAAMHGIVFQQQRQRLGIPKIINRRHFKFSLLLQQRAKHIAANPAKPINPNFNGGHGISCRR